MALEAPSLRVRRQRIATETVPRSQRPPSPTAAGPEVDSAVCTDAALAGIDPGWSAMCGGQADLVLQVAALRARILSSQGDFKWRAAFTTSGRR